MEHGHVQVLTTVDAEETARSIAHRLVEGRLAACVQVVGPISSTYRWRGEIETATEWLCIAKTTREGYPALERALLEVHPYDVPELTAMPVVAGSADYLAWIGEEVG
jgi:periplasmic divalent cation tolerance protein